MIYLYTRVVLITMDIVTRASGTIIVIAIKRRYWLKISVNVLRYLKKLKYNGIIYPRLQTVRRRIY